MHVFLDSNVVLTGAFNPNGPAGTLLQLCGKAVFSHSAYVLTECDHVIEGCAQSEEIATLASEHVRAYLAGLGSNLVRECAPPADLASPDDDDDPILGAAHAAQSDVICTYNIDDFPLNSIPGVTPLTVHRRIGDPAIEQYIQKIVLASHGTLYLFGRIHHQSSMGPIISSGNGTKVICDDSGQITLEGPNVRNIEALQSLRGNEEFHLTIRFNESTFEAAIWNRSGSGWSKCVLARGAAIFSHDTSPVLCFVPDHQFSGHIQCISGLPRYVKDRDLPRALDNYSLEALYGSLDIGSILRTE